MNKTFFDEHDLQQDLSPKYLERWANMYSLLRTVPADDRFEMGWWGAADDTTMCGTSACAAGHAALHPWFRKRGLKPQFTKSTGEPSLSSTPFDGMELSPESFFGYSSTHGFDGVPFNPDAVRQMLGLWSTDRLTPKRVAKAVKFLMEHHWGKDATAKAISKATAIYDIDAVHRYTPWNNERLFKQLNKEYEAI